MIYFLVFGLAFVVLVPSSISAGRVIGGTDAKIEDYPYMVSLHIDKYNRLIFTCGGSIITDKVVLTAAHCLYSKNIYFVRYGSSKNKDGGKLIKFLLKVQHERYSLDGFLSNDIGLLFLSESIPFGPTASSIKLPAPNHIVPNGEMLTITGWGLTNLENKTYPELLQKLTVPMVDINVCKDLGINNNRTIYPGMMCAGFIGNEGKGVCPGDSGSALVWNGTQYGVASSTFKHCAIGFPDIYSDVAYYREWIDSKIIQYGNKMII